MKRVLVFILMMMILFAGCTDNSEIIEDLNEQIDEKAIEIEDLNKQIHEQNIKIEELSKDNDLVSDEAFIVMALLKDQDWIGLSSHIHPEKGVRLSPYQYVDVNSDQVFTSDEIHSILASSKIYSWGIYDGSGELIEMNFTEYYDRFIYDEDFINASIIGNNNVVSYGNTINNIGEVYDDAYFIEFYFPGFDPQYAGMDWRSSTLVFEKYEGSWYLAGIVHGEWTI
ncbi:MAG: hypothetical protein U9Q80_07445 [Bacillota bacterium]|nr:hypothetical protein [Bacillota bacterium]